MNEAKKKFYGSINKAEIAPSFKLVSYWYEIEYNRILKNTPNYAGKDILSRIGHWYNNYYLNSITQAISNVPVSVSIQGQPYQDIIDVIEVGDKIRVHDFKELLGQKEAGSAVIYNDIKVHARLWGLEMASGIIPDEYVRWVILPNTIRYISIKVDKKMLEKSYKIVRHILEGIAREVWYPSVSDQCSHCPHLTYCSL
jgi:hypothetical protein